MRSFLPLTILALAFASAPSSAQLVDFCEDGESVHLPFNPIGTCSCEGHTWVAEGCQSAFFCEEEGTSNGCYLQCEGDDIIFIDAQAGQWECAPNTPDGPIASSLNDADRSIQVCPLGGYQLCGSSGRAPVPDEYDSNPLGSCHCDGEVWVSTGCSYAFQCDSSRDDEGVLTPCADGQVIVLSEDNELVCDDTAFCVASGIHTNCPVPLCTFGSNELGECGCEDQFFISDDCTEGFWCTTNVADPVAQNGCRKTCNPNEILQVDVAGHDWECVDNQGGARRCPGSYYVACEEEPVVPQVSECSEDCINSNLRLLVGPDCSSAFLCNDRLVGGGREIQCPEQTIVEWDPLSWQINCQEDVGQCPDMGGFRLGCKADADPDASEPLCHYSDNNLGTCECEGQFFLNADCTQGFYCHAESEGALAAGAEGCSRTCEAGYILEVDNSVEGDPRWICIDNFLGELECEGPSESKTQCVDDDDEDGAMANGVALAAVAAAGTMALIAR